MRFRILILAFLAGFAIQARATTYYMSTGGNDGNSGTIGSPWASPNHSVACGDQITAQTGTYSSANLAANKWGTVTGVVGHCVAFVVCATFDACYISGGVLAVGASHWAVMGWEVINASGVPCFEAFPNAGTQLVDILFANDVANGCDKSAFEFPPSSLSVGVDYFAVIASIGYHSAQLNDACHNAFNAWEPVQADTVAGTHIYFSQGFAWDTIDPNPCAGTAPTDGEGFILDSPDLTSYTQQVVFENNISYYNGSSGFRTDNASGGAGTTPLTYFVNNTAYANNTQTNLGTYWCGQIVDQQMGNVIVQKNILVSTTNYCYPAGSYPNWLFLIATPFNAAIATPTVSNNFGYSSFGNNFTSNPGMFTFGSNATGVDPNFVSAPGSTPGAPSCSGKASVIDCMSTIIAGFVPRASGTSGLGYQPVSGASIVDALFPSWLCQYSSQLAGLVTMGCGVSATNGAIGRGVTINRGVRVQ